MLQSEKASARYEACEELRVSKNLPNSALLALQIAANDNDPLVADAAKRALLLHSEPTIADQSSLYEGTPDSNWNTIQKILFISPIVFMIAGVCLSATWWVENYSNTFVSGHSDYYTPKESLNNFLCDYSIFAIPILGLAYIIIFKLKSKKNINLLIWLIVLLISLIPFLMKIIYFLPSWFSGVR